MNPNELTLFPAWLVEPLARYGVGGDRTPHALLIHGPTGIGKRLLGRALARSLLCEAVVRIPGGCGACPACLWFDQGSHPDFRRLTSEVIAAAEGQEADEADEEGAEEPASGTATTKSRKAPSREVRIEQVRGLQRFLSVGTHRSGARVVLLYPLEAVREVAANALLKMLEEPPPRTVFILVSDHLGRIPATLVSRCQRVPIALPAPDVAADWLRTRMADRALVGDAAAVLALSGGAPLAALERAADAEAAAGHRDLVGFLSRPSVDAAMALAEAFGRNAPAPVVLAMQRWLADCFSMRLAGRLRYHPAQGGAIGRLVSDVRMDALLELSQRLLAVRRTIDHPLNARLLFEGLFCAYADALTPVPAPA